MPGNTGNRAVKYDCSMKLPVADGCFVPETGKLDPLAKFVNVAMSNTEQMFSKQRDAVRVWKEVAQIYARANQLKVPDHKLRAGHFRNFASASFLTTAYMAGGQLTLAPWMALRSCLEAAAYALLVFHEPTKWDGWIRLRKTETEARKVGAAFGFKACLNAAKLGETDEGLDLSARALYEECIQRGAHFNVTALIANTRELNPQTLEARFATIGASASEARYAWKRVAQGGYYSLRMLETVFADEWVEAGLSHRIFKLREKINGLPQGIPGA